MGKTILIGGPKHQTILDIEGEPLDFRVIETPEMPVTPYDEFSKDLAYSALEYKEHIYILKHYIFKKQLHAVYFHSEMLMGTRLMLDSRDREDIEKFLVIVKGVS